MAGEFGCGKSTLGVILSLTNRPPLYLASRTLEIDGKRQELGVRSKIPRTWRGWVVSLLPRGAINSISPTQRVCDLVVDVVRTKDRSVKKNETIDRARDRLSRWTCRSGCSTPTPTRCPAAGNSGR